MFSCLLVYLKNLVTKVGQVGVVSRPAIADLEYLPSRINVELVPGHCVFLLTRVHRYVSSAVRLTAASSAMILPESRVLRPIDKLVHTDPDYWPSFQLRQVKVVPHGKLKSKYARCVNLLTASSSEPLSVVGELEQVDNDNLDRGTRLPSD